MDSRYLVCAVCLYQERIMLLPPCGRSRSRTHCSKKFSSLGLTARILTRIVVQSLESPQPKQGGVMDADSSEKFSCHARFVWAASSQGIHSIVMNTTLYVGIDVASKSNVAAVMDQHDTLVHKPFEFPNNQQGAEKFEETIVSACKQRSATAVRIGTEATSFYDWHLVDYLSESEQLLPFRHELYRFNPKLIKHFKRALRDTDKTDHLDAVAIAKRLRFGELPSPYHSMKEYQPLQRLTRYRLHLIREMVREKSFFLSHLFLKNSSLATEKPIKRILGATSRAVIQEHLSGEEIAQKPIEELTHLIIKASKNRYENPNDVAKLIQKVSRASYRIRPKLSHSLDLILSSSMRTIRSHQETLRNIDRAVADELEGIINTLTSVKGIGPVYSAGILAEVGDCSRFTGADALAKYAGLWWPRHQSGEFEAQERNLKRSGNSYLRYYLVEAANSMRVHNEEYQRFYQKKYKEVRKHQHKRALVLTARKLVRLVFALLKTGQVYQPEKHPSS